LGIEVVFIGEKKSVEVVFIGEKKKRGVHRRYLARDTYHLF
jgi:hypothetical protein